MHLNEMRSHHKLVCKSSDDQCVKSSYLTLNAAVPCRLTLRTSR